MDCEDVIDPSENILEAPPPSLNSTDLECTTVFDNEVTAEALEKTLALIKPEAVPHLNTIIDRIIEEGFEILQQRKVFLTPEQVSELYNEHYGQAYFALLVAHMSSGPIHALCLAKKNAIEDWKRLMGPKSVQEAKREFPNCLRAKYGDPKENLVNGVHGSDSRKKAEKEIHFFFPEMILEPLLLGEGATGYMAGSVNPTLLEGLSVLCKVKPVDPVIWLADWLLMNNPNKPQTEDNVDAAAAAAATTAAASS